jgi:hypothetical protein
VKSAVSGRVLTASFAKKIYPQYHTHGRNKKDDNVSISEDRIFEIMEDELHYYSVPEEHKYEVLQGIGMYYKTDLAEIAEKRKYFLSEKTKKENTLS